MGAATKGFLAEDLLQGKTAWITGGGTGLGRAMALRFSRLGASLALSGRRREPLEATAAEIRDAGGRAAIATCDVRDPDAVDRALATALDELGGLDILVNNAAGNFLCPSEELSPNAFAAVVGIVLHGTFHCTRAAGRGERAPRIGRTLRADHGRMARGRRPRDAEPERRGALRPE